MSRQHGEIAIGREVIMRLNERCYCCTVVDQLDWALPKIAPHRQAVKGKEPRREDLYNPIMQHNVNGRGVDMSSFLHYTANLFSKITPDIR